MTPPIQASPLRKELRVKRARLVGAFRFVLGADRENFSGICGAEKELARGIACNPGDLRGTSFGKLRENAAAINGQKRAAITGAGEEAAIGIQRKRVGDIVPRIPKLLRSGFGRKAMV